MKTTLQLRQEKDNLSSLGELTEALKYLSAAKMAKIKKQVLANRYFLQEALTTKTELQKYVIVAKKRKMKKREKQEAAAEKKRKLIGFKNQQTLIVAVMSNQGLCGRFNAQLADKINFDFPEADADLIIIGRRGKSFFSKTKFKDNLKTFIVPENVILNDLKNVFLEISNYGHVYVYYNMFLSAVKNIPVQTTFSASSQEALTAGKTKQKDSSENQTKEDLISRTYIVEPTLDKVLDYFKSVIVEAIFLQQILESRLTEYNSRMLSMKEANDNIGNLMDDLKKEYNKVRRAKINQALTEVSAGRSLW